VLNAECFFLENSKLFHVEQNESGTMRIVRNGVHS
jgi:hypothetical protein